MARYWGYWTRGKLDLLRSYLDRFTTAAKHRSTEIIYLDLFGGQPENRDRLTDEDLAGSARIALATDDAPFSRLRFFELEPEATALRTALESDFSDRDFEVVSGNCNETISGVLHGLRQVNWAPSFAFVDPNGPDIWWSTLEALAGFKPPRRTKTEIWLLLAHGMFIRTLPTDGAVRDEDAARLDRMYGTGQWRVIYEARLSGDLSPGEARDHYVNLMRWRIEQILGYRWTHPLEVVNERGRPLYHMIFATDHDAGDRIMRNLYSHAAEEFPAMRQAAREMRARLEAQRSGVMSLFDLEPEELAQPLDEGEPLYEYLPPEAPYGTS